MSTVFFDPKASLLTGNEATLNELVFNLLFCNRSATIGDRLGGGEIANKNSDLGGWWADPTFGSKLWVMLKYGKLTKDTPEQCRQYILAALKRGQDIGIFGEVEVTVEVSGTPKSALMATIKIHKPNGSVETVFYANLWELVR